MHPTAALIQLHDDIDQRVGMIRAGQPDWLCAKGCDTCCRRLAAVPQLTAGEWEEWGNPIESEEVYEYMRSYSPVENVRATEYPAVLATTSLNDIRVFYVEPTKWIQVLREKATNDPVARPILEKIEIVAGHAGKSRREGRWEAQAFVLAWLLEQAFLRRLTGVRLKDESDNPALHGRVRPHDQPMNLTMKK